MEDRTPPRRPRDSEFIDSLRKGALIGLGILVLLVPLRMVQQHRQRADFAPTSPVVQAPQATPSIVPQPQITAQAPAMAPQAPVESKPTAPPVPGVRLADFGKEDPSPDVKLMANWAVHTRDNGSRAIVLIDKKFARVYVLDPHGRLQASTPALLGEAIGDYTTPGVGDKPLSQLKKWEKTTPAGRFVAEMGENTHHQDVVWIDYENAVSMHRVIKGLPSEQRAQRLASPTYRDNRISNGCVNLPKAFYETVLAPAVKSHGAIIYVLPDTKSLPEVFSKVWDVTSPEQLALRQHAAPAKAG